MYVCVCKCVNEAELKEAIAAGNHTRRQLHDCLRGMGSQCGLCNPHVKQILSECLLKCRDHQQK